MPSDVARTLCYMLQCCEVPNALSPARQKGLSRLRQQRTRQSGERSSSTPHRYPPAACLPPHSPWLSALADRCRGHKRPGWLAGPHTNAYRFRAAWDDERHLVLAARLLAQAAKPTGVQIT
jgi:hypothetical protein